MAGFGSSSSPKDIGFTRSEENNPYKASSTDITNPGNEIGRRQYGNGGDDFNEILDDLGINQLNPDEADIVRGLLGYGGEDNYGIGEGRCPHDPNGLIF